MLEANFRSCRDECRSGGAHLISPISRCSPGMPQSPRCCAAGWRSSRLFVAGYVGYVELGGFVRGVNPSGVAAAGDVDVDERAEVVRVDAVVAVTHDGLVDVAGDDQGQRVSSGTEGLLHAGGVEQAEGDVECFAEASVAVVVDFSGVHHGADAELVVRAAGAREAGVVAGQELAECGYGAVQQDWLGDLVDRVDEGEEAVAAVGEPVTMAPVDAR